MPTTLFMRQAAIRSVFLFFALFLSSVTPAMSQTWKWGRGAIGKVGGGFLAADAFGHVYITGSFSDTTASFGTDTLTNIAGSDTTTSIFIAKYDSSGNVLWTRNIGNGADDNGFAIVADRWGNVFLSGTYTDTISFGAAIFTGDPIGENSFVAKYDSSGNLLWAKSIKSDGVGGDYVDATSIVTDVAGDVYVVGSLGSGSITFDTTTVPNPGGSGAFVARFSPSGTLVWTTVVPSNLNGSPTVAADTLGHLYLSGNFFGSAVIFGSTILTTPPGNFSIFIAKYDTAGNVQWAKATAVDSGTYETSIAASPVGDLFMTAFYSGDSVTLDTVTLTGTGSSSMYQTYLAKFDSSGHILWAKNVMGAVTGLPFLAVTADNAGNVFQSGEFFNATVSFDTCVLNNPGSTGSNAIFVTKYDAVGNVKWATGADASAGTWGACFAVNTMGQLYLAGIDNGSPLNLGPDVFAGDGQFFLARLIDTTNHIISTTAVLEMAHDAVSIVVYPNPATTQLTVSASDNINTISVTDVIGQTIYSQLLTANCKLVQVDLAALPSGLYFVKVNNSEVRKFVKE